MDGNGRWAQSRLHSRVWGHIRGASVVSGIVEEADSLGVDALTLYAFSTENWSRPESEVSVLFNLLKKFLLNERKRIIKNRIRFKVMGDISGLPDGTKKLISDLEAETDDYDGLKLTFAFGYGGRNEIICAVNRFIKENPGVEISEGDLTSKLYIPDIKDVDLLIRTGGDQRISNFLLWQIAYAELSFTDTAWPDFTRKEFRNIINIVSCRERRFGNICSSTSYEDSMRKACLNKKILTETRLN